MADEAAAATEPVKTSEEYRRNFELAREVAVINQAPGQVSRLSVAVAIDDRAIKNKKSPKEIQEIEKLIKSTVGFSTDRGDQVAVTARRFNPVNDDQAAEPWYETSWFGMLVRNLSALLVALLLVFGIGRPILKRWQNSEKALRSKAEQEAAEESAAALPGQDRPATLDGGSLVNQTTDGSAQPVTIDMITSAKSYQERALLTQNFVKQNPDHAALVVKELLKEADTLEDANG